MTAETANGELLAVRIFAIGDTDPSAGVAMSSQQLDALVTQLRDPSEVITVTDVLGRTVIIPVRSVAGVFVGEAGVR